jgi:hypothetical protein
MTWQSTYKKFLVHFYIGKNLDVKLCTRRKSLDLRITSVFPSSRECKRCTNIINTYTDLNNYYNSKYEK